MARECPTKEKNKNKAKDKDTDKDEEVTLRVCTECVEYDTEEVCDMAQQCDNAFFDTFGVSKTPTSHTNPSCGTIGTRRTVKKSPKCPTKT